MNALIIETTNFELVAREKPHIDREDGGHLTINPKIPRESYKDFTSDELIELIHLQVLGGMAMENGLKKLGIDLDRINYQTNANFKRSFHTHLYGRAKSSKIQQKYGTTLQFKESKEDFLKQIEGLKPLSEQEIESIKEEAKKLLKTNKFKLLTYENNKTQT